MTSQNPQGPRDNLQPPLSTGLGLAFALLVSGGLFILFRDWGNDDPYITYRYAENLYAGRGFVYNPGDPTLSTTTPLFALLLFGVRFFTSNLPFAANLIGTISIGAGAYFLWDIARNWNEPVASWAVLLLYPTFGWVVQTLGSETPLFLALCLAAIAAYLRKKMALAGALLALAVLTRGDGAILALVLAADWIIKHPPRSLSDLRQLPWQAVGAGFAILMVWVVFAEAYFGSPLPVTLSVKRAQGVMAISESFASGFLTVLGYSANSLRFWIEGFLFFIGVFYVIFRAHRWLLLLGWAVLYFAAYSILGVTRYFWYYASLVPGIMGIVGVGAAYLYRVNIPSRVPSRVIRSIVSLTLIGLAIMQAAALLELRTNPDPRLVAYRMVGEWLAENTRPEASVGTLEVGVIGYYAAPRPMVDFAGLIQPEVAEIFTPEATYLDSALWAVNTYTPNLLVLHDGAFPQLEQSVVAEYCSPVERFLAKETGYSQDLVIYRCQYP